jgi:autotransporter-associated beta strand protein
MGAHTMTVNSGDNGLITGGTATVTFGATTLTGNATFQVDNNVAGVTSRLRLGAVAGAGFGFTKTGSGDLELTAAGTATGVVRIGAGNLILGNGAALVNANLDMNAGDSGTLGFGSLTSAQIGVLTGSRGILLENDSSAAVTLTLGGGSAPNVPSDYAGTFSGAGGILKGGPQSLILSGNSTFTGQFSLNRGNVSVNRIGNTGESGPLGQNGIIILGGANNVTQLDYTGGGETSDKQVQVGSGGAGATAGSTVASSGSGALVFNHAQFNSVDTGAVAEATRTLTLGGTYAAGTNRIDGAIVDNNAINLLGLRVTGATWQLGGNSTYTGDTTLSAGVLVADHANALGTGNITFSSAGGNTGTLRYTSASAGTDWASRIKNSTGTIRLDTGDNTVTLAGVIDSSNVDGLAKSGTGALGLAGANTFSGGTTLGEGTLRLDHINAAGTGTITQSSAASTLQINTSGTIANNMSVYKVAFLQSATLSGTITVNNAEFDVAADESSTISGAIAGTGGVNKTGLGQLTLTGDNTYTGAVAVNAGVLELASTLGGAAASTVSVSVASGARLLLSQSDQVNNAATVSLSGGTIQRGGNVSEVFGNLNLTTTSFLDYGAGNDAGTIRFGTYTPSSLLTVQNFLPGNKLQFGNTISSTDLNNATLFSFSNGFTTGTESGFFTITAIPEPSTCLAGAGLLAMLLWPTRRALLRTVAKAAAPVKGARGMDLSEHSVTRCLQNIRGSAAAPCSR